MAVNFGNGNTISNSSNDIRFNASSASNAIIFRQDGRTEQNRRPCGVVTNSYNGARTDSGGYFPGNLSGYQRGGHYSLQNSTGQGASRFITPTRGVYHFEWNTIVRPGGAQFLWRKNGGQMPIGSGAPYSGYGYHTGSWATASGGVTVLLSAGDYMQLRIESSSGGAWHGGHYSGVTFWMVG